jgi:hypothetical protein
VTCLRRRSSARATAVSREPDDTLSTWAPDHFSAGGSAEVERILGDAAARLTDPEAKARAAFGVHAAACQRPLHTGSRATSTGPSGRRCNLFGDGGVSRARPVRSGRCGAGRRAPRAPPESGEIR